MWYCLFIFALYLCGALGVLDYHSGSRRAGDKEDVSDVQIESDRSITIFQHLEIDLILADINTINWHVVSHCHLSVIPLLLRLRWKRKKHSVWSILANWVERINPSLLRSIGRSSVVVIEHAHWEKVFGSRRFKAQN